MSKVTENRGSGCLPLQELRPKNTEKIVGDLFACHPDNLFCEAANEKLPLSQFGLNSVSTLTNPLLGSLNSVSTSTNESASCCTLSAILFVCCSCVTRLTHSFRINRSSCANLDLKPVRFVYLDLVLLFWCMVYMWCVVI